MSSVPPARRERVLVVVLAGGVGSRLGPLTDRRAKPALPFAGMYRLIDITLSNVAHSGLSDVWVLEQYQPHDLNDHLANGRAWDLDRTHGGLQILPPYQADADAGVEGSSGNADALVRHRSLLADAAVDVIVTMSADHVYRLDLRDVLDTHAAAGADVTIVSTDPPSDDDPSRFGWITAGEDGAVRDFVYKPDGRGGDRVCCEVIGYRSDALLAALTELPSDGSAADYGHRLLPMLVAAGRAVEHRLGGYWRDVGTVDAYHAAHLELLGEQPALDFDDPSWPILTSAIIGGPARVLAGAAVRDALLSPGAVIAGRVEHSVVGRDARIEAGATVRDSVVLDGAVVRAGAVVERAVVDVGVAVDTASAPQRLEGCRVDLFTEDA